tara:strand:+ start:342 stop:1367 length:1026 start_codon:yes stop_codon:yes gene_type:complete
LAILINPFRFAAVGGAPHWQELGRTTLGSAGALDVSFTAKPYLMFLIHGVSGGSNTDVAHRFNSDSGSNYALRKSDDGGSDGTDVSATSTPAGFWGDANDGFHVSTWNNIEAQEKLGIGGSVVNTGTGAGNAPHRNEHVGKWANTTAQISSRQDAYTNPAGSEVVVLGYDPEDTTGTNAWEELASVDLSGGASDTISSGTFTAKKYLMYELYTENDSGNASPYIRVGNGTVDSGSNYARRNSGNGGTDGTNASDTYFGGTWYGATSPNYITGFIINKSDTEKLGFAHGISQETAGAGNAPTRYEEVMKWVNTSAQINIIDAVNADSGDFGTNSSLKVWGFD